MKTIGLIGGMSWESTAHYYTLINTLVKQRLGAHHSAKILLYSLDFEEVAQLQFAGKWDEATAIMVDAAKLLERGGSDFVLIGSNTMHISAQAVEESVGIPLLHVADATAERIIAKGIRRVGLLGTAFTMEREFYRGRLCDKFGIDVLTPGPDERKLVQHIIYEELILGMVKAESKAKLGKMIADLVAAGAEGIILGCTELMMIVEQADSPVPLFDTTTIHSEIAVERALA
jgi:aspartate racemase